VWETIFFKHSPKWRVDWNKYSPKWNRARHVWRVTFFFKLANKYQINNTVMFNNLFCSLWRVGERSFPTLQLQLLMDNTIKVKPSKKNSASAARLEGLSRRLMFKLHIKRTKLLESDRDKIQTTMKKRI